MAPPRTQKNPLAVPPAPETRVAQVERPEKNEVAAQEPMEYASDLIEFPTQGTTMLGSTPNERLHRRAVSKALSHLTTMQNSLKALEGHSSTAMWAPHAALHAEMKQLVMTDPAYRDAAALMFVGVRPE